MGKCKYCGMDAGLLSSVHQACEEKHAIGLADVDSCIKRYFMGQTDIINVRSVMMNVRRNAFVVKDDAIMLSANAIDAYTKTLPANVNNKHLQYVLDYLNGIKLTRQDLASTGCIERLEARLIQSNIVANLKIGILPSGNVTATIMLGKGEAILWSYSDVTMYQEKVERIYKGKRDGWSMHVAKGLTYHTGGSTSKPIENRYMNNEGTGTLYVTNKHLIFQCLTASVRVPYKKIVGVTPYTDGIEVHRDGVNTKRLAFQGFDSGFVMNVMQLSLT